MPYHFCRDPAMVTVPLEAGGAHIALHARVSTPGKPFADKVDPALPTILFCHPTWLDSFFFYPQIDDPLFTDHYNLIAFDMRGHGLTKVDGRDAGYDAWAAADDLAYGLAKLGINQAHVVGCAFGALVASNLASKYPSVVQSLILISLPPERDSADTAAGYVDCQDTLVQATAQQDGELLDSITTATFEYDVGPLAPAVREIRDEYMCMARDCRLKETQEEAATEAFYVFDPVLNRRPQSAAEIAGIAAPTLILQGCTNCGGKKNHHRADAENYATLFNFVHAQDNSTARASLHLVQGAGHYMTLTSPNVVNPLIAKFIGTPSSAGLPPLPPASTRIYGPALARRPSTPRSAQLKFDLPPIPRKWPGMRTIGDELDRLNVDVEVVTSDKM